MRKKSLLMKTMLLLCALVAGSMSGWAEENELLSWSRSSTTDTYTKGYTLVMNKTNAKTGYYQDSGTKNSDVISFTLYNTSDKLFSSAPSTVTFHAKLGGGTTKDPLDYSVYACFVDETGKEIDGSAVVVTTKITNTNGSDFSASMPVAKATDAYGVKIYHMKEDGWNVRYYSFSLGYEAATKSEASVPDFTLTAGEYIYGTTVEISSTNSKKIYYTTDGTDPTTSSMEYSSPIAITSTMTVKAFAVDNNDEPTIIVSRTFNLKTPDAPTFLTAAGNVTEGTEVSISAEAGCVISYTTDGTDPSSSGTATQSADNTALVTINTTTTIRAIAIDGGTNKSAESSAKYVVLDADAMTESKTSFSEKDYTEGKLVSDISYKAFRGGANNDPYYQSSTNGIRLYQISGSNSYGGYVTLTAPTGFKIIQVKITSTSTYATTVTYTVDGSTDVTANSQYSLAKSSDYTIDGLNNESVSIFNLGTGSSGRLEIGAISVAYTGSETIELASACNDGTNYYGTFSNTHAFVIPDGITASEIKVEEGKLVVSKYTEGAVVPANTGVLLSSSVSGVKSIKFTGREGTSVLNDGNMLKPSGEKGLTAAGMVSKQSNESAKYYRLTMHNGTQIGFWWGAANGGAFEIGANKAYLAVPETTTVRAGFSLFGDEDTAIGGVENELSNNAPVYNMQGQRVNGSMKGILIQNGKKFINK